MIKTKRAYEDPAPDDGTRFLVDRFWPRGVKKEALHMDTLAERRRAGCQSFVSGSATIPKNGMSFSAGMPPNWMSTPTPGNRS